MKKLTRAAVILASVLFLSTDIPVHMPWDGPYRALASPETRAAIHAAITQFFELPYTIRLRVNTGTLPLARVFRLLGPFIPPRYRDWEWDGSAIVTGIIHRNHDSPDSPTTLELQVTVLAASFTSSDGRSLGNHISGSLTFVLRGDRRQGEVQFEGTIDLEGGEILIDQFYGNINKTPVHLDLKGSYELVPDIIVLEKYVLRLLPLGSVVGSGTITSPWAFPTFSFHCNPITISHESAFTQLIKEPFQDEYPGLGHISCAGTSTLDVRIEGNLQQVTVEGQLVMENTRVQLQDGVVVEGLQTDLPFLFRLPVLHQSAAPDETRVLPSGFISIQEIRAQGVAIGPLTIPIQPLMNGLATTHPLSIPLFEGRVDIPYLTLQDIGSPNAAGHFSIDIRDVDLLALSREYSPFAIAGILEGAFPSITLQKGVLSADGSVAAHVFGGRIVLKNLHGERVLSRLRRIIMDVRLMEIDLEQATGAIPFGKITGFVEGSIDDLAFSFGQPEQFDLRVESVPDRRVPRTFEARAVENLIILGSGSPAAVFQKGISSFFKTFPYSRLGVRCTLENDMFTLRGTIQEEGVEYLVRRSFLRGIDVINKNPRNTIRWADMMERLQRVLTEQGEKPKIITP